MLKSSGQVAQKFKSKNMYLKTFFCVLFELLQKRYTILAAEYLCVSVCQQFSHCQTINKIFLGTNSQMTKEHTYILV